MQSDQGTNTSSAIADAHRITACPLISMVQQIAVYETKARLFIIGSDNTQQRFRVLKIDRSEPAALTLHDDRVEYTQAEIRSIMHHLDEGNRGRAIGGLGSQGLVRKVSAFGIVGFIRFTEGYYLVVITQRRRVAIIGHHVIYKIEDTKMVYIPNGSLTGGGAKKRSADEQRYARIFQSIGLGSNFYFSYSYDLTRTLQANMTPPRLTPQQFARVFSATQQQQHQASTCKESHAHRGVGRCADSEAHTAKCVSPALCDGSCAHSPSAAAGDPLVVGVRCAPHRRFLWNAHLLSPVSSPHGEELGQETCGGDDAAGEAGLADGGGVAEGDEEGARLSWPWRLAIIHGYLGQALLYVKGRGLLITLIARRSSLYAGTRFLKRGANFAGDVANEVETEQIVGDTTVSSLQHGLFSSHVQMRGSVPSHWYQDPGRIPKPPIQMDIYDPCYLTAGRHFSNLLARYGAPVHVVNLVKRGKQGRSREKQLHSELHAAISYLNRFVPSRHRLLYISLDMARINKLKRESVMLRLTDIAEHSLHRTGFYLSQPPAALACKFLERCYAVRGGGLRQTGVVRTNCVDCLDRTNTAQFAIGKAALALQLCSMGVLPAPQLAFDTDCLAILEEMYEDHGDVLALQYGGSQLVHRISTYRKTARWGSHGNDIVQTVQRYYSNTFSDSDKQNAINLFLGVYLPWRVRCPLWDLPSDSLLHHRSQDRDINKFSRTKWWSDNVLRQLPLPFDETVKRCVAAVPVAVPVAVAGLSSGGRQLRHRHHYRHSYVDLMAEHYRPGELSTLAELFIVNIAHSARDYMPAMCMNDSPFVVRCRGSELAPPLGAAAPPLYGSSADSDISDSDGVSSGDDARPVSLSLSAARSPVKSLSPLAAHTLPRTASQRSAYGINIIAPGHNDLALYQKYVQMGRRDSEQDQAWRGAAPGPTRVQTLLDTLRACQRPLAIQDRSRQPPDTSCQPTGPCATEPATATAIQLYKMSVESFRVIAQLSAADHGKYVAAAAPYA